MPHQRAATEAMLWKNTDYEVLNTIRDGYFFAGASWNRQTAKRFILKNKRVQNVIEASYYLHLADHDKPVNVAFEPSTSFGCSVGCLFCASGTLFPIKALRAEEITEQVNTLILSYRDDFPYVHTTVREDVFYSGIGEPTLMMNTLIEASKQILTQHPHLQFKISTMGANPSALIRWAHSGLPLRSVQIGIPHYDNEKIKTLYSQCKKYDLEAVLAAIKEFMVIRPETADIEQLTIRK